MTDKIYGRVFDSSTAGWIADLIISGQISNYEASIGALWAYEAIQDASITAIVIGTGFLKESSLGTDFVWDNGVLDVSVAPGVDPSINDLYNYVEDLSTYTYSHTHSQDASIGELFNEIENLPQDASIVDLYNYTLDLSTRLDNFDPAQDASIVDLYYIKADKTEIYSKSYIDGSLNAKDTSIASLTGWNVSQDASLVLKADKTYVDASLGAKVNQTLFDTSIASLTGWNLSQDASLILKADKTYVDGSLNLKLNIADASATYLKINDASSNFAKRLTSITTFNTAYTVNPSDNLNVIQCDASMVVTFPNTLETGFQTTVVNASTGWVTLEASTLLTTDASIRLKNQYAGATVIHKGSGVFFAFGNLQ